jgi:Protein of unknown function (DUF4232)
MRYKMNNIRHLIATVGTTVGVTAGTVAAVYAIPPAASAAPSAPAVRAMPALSMCSGASHDLRVRLIATKQRGAAGDTYYTLQFANTGGTACTMSGFPAIAAITRTGKQLGSPAGHGLMTIISRVVLAPGAKAHTTLIYHARLVSAGGGCGTVENAFELRIGMAGQKSAVYVAFGSRSCSRAGHVFLTVTESVRTGAGTT